MSLFYEYRYINLSYVSFWLKTREKTNLIMKTNYIIICSCTSIHVTSINVLKIMWTIKYIKKDQLLKLYSIFSFHNLLKNPWIIRKLSDKKHLSRPACILYKVLISKLSDLISLTHTYTQTDICDLSWTYFTDLWCQKYCTKVPKS